MIIKIALRNILRHKRRTLISAITVAVGLAIFIFFDSLMSGIDRSSLENMINLTDGSLKVYSKEYAAEKMAYPLQYGIDNVSSIREHLNTLPEIKGVTPRISFLSEIINGDQTLRIVGSVIQPDSDKQVYTLSKYVTEGRFFSKNSTNEVLLGKSLAQDLGIGVGDTVMLAARNRYDAYNAQDFQVAGLLETAAPVINESGVFITFQAAELFLDTQGLVTELTLHVPWSKAEDMTAYLHRVNAIKDKINARFPTLTTSTFYDANGSFIELTAGKKKAQSMIAIFILLIGAVGIVNTVLMSVYERIREVGVLRSLGFQPGQIMKMFLLEGMFIGLVGSIIGALMGVLLNIWLVYTGFDVSFLGGKIDASQFPIWGVFYGQWNIKTFIAAFILGIGIAVLAAYVPARKAARISPKECLKFT